jgi:hypothetical protein
MADEHGDCSEAAHCSRAATPQEGQRSLQESIGLMAARELHCVTFGATRSVEEIRRPNIRAHQNELAGARNVSGRWRIEAFMPAYHLWDAFDHVALQSQLSLVAGTMMWSHGTSRNVGSALTLRTK